MLDLPTCLRYYKRKDIQEAIVASVRDREVAVSYGGKGYGKRPDVIMYPQEILEFVKRGVTSFHVSEERWEDPLALIPGMPQKELQTLRSGWDLVIDIDSIDFTISKTAAHFVVKALNDHGITSIFVKFSGNKGFHIAVPFESFPKEFNGEQTSDQFPDLPKKIAEYLINYIKKTYVTVNEDLIKFGEVNSFSLESLKTMDIKENPIILVCDQCKKKKEDRKLNDSGYFFVCPNCDHKQQSQEDYVVCDKCSKIMQMVDQVVKQSCSCGSTEFTSEFNILSVIDIDTLLLSSRHLYRCVYSLHEKSGLASIPIRSSQILEFDKQSAKPESVTVVQNHFLQQNVPNEAAELISKASEATHKVEYSTPQSQEFKEYKEFETMTEAAPKDYFPPCMHNILKGMQDGKKRALFAMVTFLLQVGWSKDAVQEFCTTWNETNAEPLKEAELLGLIRHHTMRQQKLLPPNCSNDMYYTGLGICTPDNLCKRIKNPVSYTRRRMFAKK